MFFLSFCHAVFSGSVHTLFSPGVTLVFSWGSQLIWVETSLHWQAVSHRHVVDRKLVSSSMSNDGGVAGKSVKPPDPDLRFKLVPEGLHVTALTRCHSRERALHLTGLGHNEPCDCCARRVLSPPGVRRGFVGPCGLRVEKLCVESEFETCRTSAVSRARRRITWTFSPNFLQIFSSAYVLSEASEATFVQSTEMPHTHFGRTLLTANVSRIHGKYVPEQRDRGAHSGTVR